MAVFGGAAAGGLEERLERWLAVLSLRVVLCAMALVLFLIAWNRGVALLYGMFALVVAIVLVAYVTPRLNLRGIEARRSHAPTATEGDRLELVLEVAPPGARPRYMVEIVDRLPFAAEDERAPMGFVGRIKGRTRLSMSVSCDLRGEHVLGPLTVRTGYPLGVRNAERTLSNSTSTIVIYPRTFPIRTLRLPGDAHLAQAGARTAQRPGSGDQFLGLRDYRAGDAPRHVHWRASARRRELVVKEFEFTHNSDVFIVLDLDASSLYGEGKESTLEYMVRIAASIARHALHEGHCAGLLGLGSVAHEIPLGRGMAHFQRMLEPLARVRADGVTPYQAAVHRAACELRRGTLVLFDIGHPERPATVALRPGTRPLWIGLDAESFDYPLRPASRPPASRHYCVRRGDDLAQVFAG